MIDGAWRRARIARHGRAVVRLAVLGVSLAAWVAAELAVGLAPVAGAAARRARVRRAWARAASRIIGMRVVASGAPPRGPVVLVANHMSYVDIVALMTQCPAVFVAKSEVAGWPGIGWIARRIGTLFIERARVRDILRIVDGMRDALERGDPVAFFPEATTTSGRDVAPFKSSLFEAAARTGAPVVCATLHFVTDDPADHPTDRICWWGDMTFADHLYALLGVRGFETHVRFAPEPLRSQDRKELARASRALVEASFEPVAVASASASRAAERLRA